MESDPERRETVQNRKETPWTLQAWDRFESLINGMLSADMPLEEALAIIDSTLEIARAMGPLPETPIQETVARVARLHRALACLSG